MNRGVVYMIVGGAHAAGLVVSLASLRKFYTGPVTIFTEPSGSGRDCAELCAADARLGDTQVAFDAEVQRDAAVPWRGGGKIFRTKCLLPNLSPYEQTIYLDCDTLITGDISELWPDYASGEVVLTGFRHLHAQTRTLTRRLREWAKWFPERVKRAQSAPYPHVNTGILSYSKAPGAMAFAADWFAVSEVNSRFTDDEVAAQIVCPDHNVRHLDERFNRSPVYQGQHPDVRIWHLHRRMNWRDPVGRAVWLPAYLAAVDENLADIRRWPIHRYHWRSVVMNAEARGETWPQQLAARALVVSRRGGSPAKTADVLPDHLRAVRI